MNETTRENKDEGTGKLVFGPYRDPVLMPDHAKAVLAAEARTGEWKAANSEGEYATIAAITGLNVETLERADAQADVLYNMILGEWQQGYWDILTDQSISEIERAQKLIAYKYDVKSKIDSLKGVTGLEPEDIRTFHQNWNKVMTSMISAVREMRASGLSETELQQVAGRLRQAVEKAKGKTPYQTPQ